MSAFIFVVDSSNALSHSFMKGYESVRLHSEILRAIEILRLRISVKTSISQLSAERFSNKLH